MTDAKMQRLFRLVLILSVAFYLALWALSLLPWGIVIVALILLCVCWAYGEPYGVMHREDEPGRFDSACTRERHDDETIKSIERSE